VILDLFSKRRRHARGEVPDVLVYDRLPDQLRVQIVLVWHATVGVASETTHHLDRALARPRQFNAAWRAFDIVAEQLRHQRGVFELFDNPRTPQEEVERYFLREQDVERALDVLECVAPFAPEAEPEINQRLMEHGVGYQLHAGKIVRADSNWLHAEVVKPALRLLNKAGFSGAEDEFRRAHDHLRHQRYDEALVEALKAMESTIRHIAAARGWKVDPKDTIKTLLATCFGYGLVPAYMQSQFGTLKGLLESGLPALRNREGGHGRGPEGQRASEAVARFGLNTCAANICFLVDLHESR